MSNSHQSIFKAVLMIVQWVEPYCGTQNNLFPLVPETCFMTYTSCHRQTMDPILNCMGVSFYSAVQQKDNLSAHLKENLNFLFCYVIFANFTLLLLLSRFSHVRLCATPQTTAHQAPLSLGFSRQEHWNGLPLPSPMHESESEVSVVSDSSRPHGLQPTRLLCPWEFPGKSTGVGCHYFSITYIL